MRYRNALVSGAAAFTLAMSSLAAGCGTAATAPPASRKSSNQPRVTKERALKTLDRLGGRYVVDSIELQRIQWEGAEVQVWKVVYSEKGTFPYYAYLLDANTGAVLIDGPYNKR